MTNIIKGVPTEARLFGGLYASLYADNHTYRVIVYPQSQIRTVCEDRAELKEYIGVHRKTALIVYIKKRAPLRPSNR